MSPQTFLTVLQKVRKSKGLSRDQLAQTLDSSSQAVKRAESGQGSSQFIIRMMFALDFHLAGLAKGRTLPDQLSATRLQLKMSQSELAKRASISRQTVREIEAGRGTIASMLRILEVLGPNSRPRQAAARPMWQYDPQASERDVKFTPPDFLAAVVRAFGPIDLDPCGHPKSHVKAHRRISIVEGQDGLVDAWSGDLAFVNPPFSALLKWLRRAEAEWRAGHIKRVIALVPARLDSSYVHDELPEFARIYVLRGRLKFWTEAGPSSAAPFGLMCVFMGVDDDQIAAFTNEVPGNWFADRQSRY